MFTVISFHYLDQSISGPVTLSSQWTELVPTKALSINRQIQMVVLDLDKSINLQRDGFELLLPDGSTVTPEVQLVDLDGNVYPLTQPSEWFSPSTGVKYREFSSKNDLPKDKLFRCAFALINPFSVTESFGGAITCGTFVEACRHATSLERTPNKRAS